MKYTKPEMSFDAFEVESDIMLTSDDIQEVAPGGDDMGDLL
ncbi:MAG: hypothetical protein ACI4RN_08950 [Oscillospiraceae bacterium]